jgi:outer membrane protein
MNVTLSRLWVYLFTGLLACSTQIQLLAQTPKFAHVNVELLVSYMPEAKSMDGELRTLEQKLMEKMNVKQVYYESKVQEYTEKKEKGMPKTEDEAAQKMILDLQKEIKEFASDAEVQIGKKRQDLLTPILDKLQKAIDEVAEANGYAYVINSNIGGNSILVKAPKQDDLTLRILKKLNISVPKEVEDALNGVKPAVGGK